MKVYFAAPQNTPYQRAFVLECVNQLKNAGFVVYLAADEYLEDQSAFAVTMEADGKPLYSDESAGGTLAKSAKAGRVFVDNYIHLKRSDALVALLDGSQVDDRVACEIGLFYGLMHADKTKKGILGLATDARCLLRRDTAFGVNIFTMGTLEEVGKAVENLDALISELGLLSEE